MTEDKKEAFTMGNELGDQERLLKDLSMVVGKLDVKLTPILLPIPKDNEEEGIPDCPLYIDTIKNNNDRIRRLIKTIESMLDRASIV